jgi:hypothetical protein
MSNDKLRRQILFEAARMLYVRQESDYYRAKLKAGRRVCQGWVKPSDLPTDREIREEIQAMVRMNEAGRFAGEPQLRSAAARQDGSPTDDRELPEDRFELYRTLLTPLETVKQDPLRHPEGDALYHSLQVFEHARQARPYDEEFQTAALLHDVGKAIDPREHVRAALAELDGHITPRTAWFIEHHHEVAQLREGSLGVRARRRLEAHEDYDDLLLLAECDRAGRERGAQVPDIEEALEHLRQLAQEDDDAGGY